MSLVETCTVLALLTILVTTGIGSRVSSFSSTRLRTAATAVKSAIALNAARAVMEGREVKLNFKQSTYEVSPGRRGAKSSATKLPPGIIFTEARFGSGGKNSAILNLSPSGVSSPGRLVLNSTAPSTDQCIITRSLRGLTKVTCDQEPS
jgi:Tfp pilus assembly protein FimT